MGRVDHGKATRRRCSSLTPCSACFPFTQRRITKTAPTEPPLPPTLPLRIPSHRTRLPFQLRLSLAHPAVPTDRSSRKEENHAPPPGRPSTNTNTCSFPTDSQREKPSLPNARSEHTRGPVPPIDDSPARPAAVRTQDAGEHCPWKDGAPEWGGRGA